jgi:hypothetical protein
VPTCDASVTPAYQVPHCVWPPTQAPVPPFGTVISVSPQYQIVPSGQTFEVDVDQNAAGATTGGQVDLYFNPDVVQIVDVQPGDIYKRLNSALLMGVGPDTKEQSIAPAPTTAEGYQASLPFSTRDTVISPPARPPCSELPSRPRRLVIRI